MVSAMALKSGKAAASETLALATDADYERTDATRSCLAVPVAIKLECPVLAMIPSLRGKYQEGEVAPMSCFRDIHKTTAHCLRHYHCLAGIHFSYTDDPLAMSSTLKLALSSSKIYFVPIT